MARKRSASYDGTGSSTKRSDEEDHIVITLPALEHEEEEVELTMYRQEGIVHVLEAPWLDVICNLFSPRWYQRYLRIGADRLILSASADHLSGVYLALSSLSVSSVNTLGHNGEFHCLKLSSQDKSLTISLGSYSELQEWQSSLQRTQLQQSRHPYFWHQVTRNS
jgi:hypothetical protein